MFGQPLQVEPDELLKSESLHIVVVDDVDAEVQQVFAVFYLCGNQRTDVQLQLVEHGFVHDAVAVYQMLEQSVFRNSPYFWMVARCSSDTSMLRVPLVLACMVYMSF